MSRPPLRALLGPLILLPAVLLAQSPRSPSEQSAGIDATERTQIDSVFGAYDKPNVPGCALGLFRDGQVAYGRGYGWADLERAVPITTATLFDIGSTSKQFAAASVALLVQEHKLSFSDDVRKYIAELPDYGSPITIDHLMRHTSGLRDYNALLALAGHSLEDVTTDSQALALIVRQRHLNFPTGSRYEYSNTGYFLLSVIVQRVTKQSLADFARERIFLPLGMRHTRYRDHFAMVIPGRALGYAPEDTSGRFKISMSNWEETGDGAVHLSIDDALAWDENFYHPRVGGQWMVQQLQTRGKLANGDSISYARGLVIGTYRGLRRVEHGGAWIGYRAAYARYPDQHTSVVILCNSDAISPDKLSDQVADIVLANDFTEGKLVSSANGRTTPRAVAALPTRRLVGSYFAPRTDDIFRVVNKNGAPALDFAGQSFTLEPTGPSTFAFTGLPVSVSFLADGESAARALRLRLGADDSVEALRFTPATPNAEQLRAYAGSYYSPELDVTWRITMEHGHLVLGNSRSDLMDIAGELHPEMSGAFTAGSGFLRFTRDRAGRVTGLELSASRVRGVRFDRRAR